jgi:uncharacterized membrane protein YidH (DUF202 family)
VSTQEGTYQIPDVEHSKIVHDYLKHLTTLSTGSIVLITAFLEKLFTQPQWKFLVIVSILGFMLCVLACVLAQTLLLYYGRLDRKSDEKMSLVGALSLFAAWIGFLIGVVALSVFAIRNFL